ncbi:hypothetical protein H4R33_006296 [Dimargaris cristalligena]|nr:hypothetical protein H4R33_006296 [Dimargaris cristalligena]
MACPKYDDNAERCAPESDFLPATTYNVVYWPSANPFSLEQAFLATQALIWNYLAETHGPEAGTEKETKVPSRLRPVVTATNGKGITQLRYHRNDRVVLLYLTGAGYHRQPTRRRPYRHVPLDDHEDGEDNDEDDDEEKEEDTAYNYDNPNHNLHPHQDQLAPRYSTPPPPTMAVELVDLTVDTEYPLGLGKGMKKLASMAHHYTHIYAIHCSFPESAEESQSEEQDS